MTPRTTPPPIPASVQKKGKILSYTKIWVIFLMTCVLMIGTGIVWLISDSRDSKSWNVSNSIIKNWGESISVKGPYAKSVSGKKEAYPEYLNSDAEVKALKLHRGIYETEVFNAHIKIQGSFCRDSLVALGDTLIVTVQTSGHNFSDVSRFSLGEKSYRLNKNNGNLEFTLLTADLPEQLDFNTSFSLRGSREISFTTSGGNDTINIYGDAKSPSFNGDILPARRQTTDDRFNAEWEIEGSGIQEVGTEFLVGVDRYQKVARTLKYAFLIIVLTFTAVLFTEVIKKFPIPVFNYFLIGCALVIFYTLLLSFCEFMSFGLAFLIAAAMTISLITGYMWRMLRSRGVGLVIGLILTVIYTTCYTLICISTYALLLGSLVLFLTLTGLMYASLKIKY